MLRMGSNRRRRALVPALMLACASVLSLAAAGAASAAKGEPLVTAIIEHEELDHKDVDLALKRARDGGLTAYRVILRWYEVAPVERPENFDAEDPAHPAYRWEAFDLKIRRLRAFGLEPLVTVNYPPLWAGGGYMPHPDPAEFGRFLKAAARRYSGDFQGLPRIRNWMIWNEPNVLLFLSPQVNGEQLISPANYRTLVNEGAAAVKSVKSDNVVIAGGLSPFGVPQDVETRTIPPLRFMRELLCLSNGAPPVPTCSDKTAFDVWASHPYTRGGPTRQATNPEDASIGDLTEVKQILDAGVRAGHIVASQKLRHWVTEFSWDTSPPDPNAVPMRLQARWTAEALYRMWKNGVSLVTWLQLRDFPYPQSETQAGVYFRGGPSFICDRPKLTLGAYRFPFVAFKEGRFLSVWGRTPRGVAGKVVVEQLSGKKWKKIATVSTDRFGIFERRYKKKATRGSYVEASSYTRAYRELVTCDGASAYWRLGERAGTAARDEVNGGSGSYASGVGLNTRGALASDNDPAVTLSAGDTKVSLGMIDRPRTVELWLKTRATNAVAFSNRNDVNHFVYLGVSASGRLLVFDSAPLESSRAVNDDAWHHVVYTYDGRTGRLYVDGALEASAEYTRLEGAAPASLGFDAALQNRFVGSLDELAVYANPLSADQVRAHFTTAARNLTVRQSAKLSGSYLRARLTKGATSSLPFSLARPPDVTYNPFG